MVINGRSWPWTERFDLLQGDTIYWRWLNPTPNAHPMHLHGFFYDVTSRGSWAADTVLERGPRQVVTETMLPGSTFAMRWVAERPGNWLFHCHFAFHVSHFLSFRKIPDPEDADPPGVLEHSASSMRGLILGLHVRERNDRPGEAVRGTESAAASAADTATPPRRVRLLVDAKNPGPREQFGYVVQNGAEPARDSVLALHAATRRHVHLPFALERRRACSSHWRGGRHRQGNGWDVPPRTTSWRSGARWRRMAPICPPRSR